MFLKRGQNGFALLWLFIYIIWVHISNIFASKIVQYMTENIQRPARQAFLALVHRYIWRKKKKKKDNNKKKITFSLRLLHTLWRIQYKDIWYNHDCFIFMCVRNREVSPQDSTGFFLSIFFFFNGWRNGQGRDQTVFFSTQGTKMNGRECSDKGRPWYVNLKRVLACFANSWQTVAFFSFQGFYTRTRWTEENETDTAYSWSGNVVFRIHTHCPLY